MVFRVVLFLSRAECVLTAAFIRMGKRVYQGMRRALTAKGMSKTLFRIQL